MQFNREDMDKIDSTTTLILETVANLELLKEELTECFALPPILDLSYEQISEEIVETVVH